VSLAYPRPRPSPTTRPAPINKSVGSHADDFEQFHFSLALPLSMVELLFSELHFRTHQHSSRTTLTYSVAQMKLLAAFTSPEPLYLGQVG
jgi:hypothetical protein